MRVHQHVEREGNDPSQRAQRIGHLKPMRRAAEQPQQRRLEIEAVMIDGLARVRGGAGDHARGFDEMGVAPDVVGEEAVRHEELRRVHRGQLVELRCPPRALRRLP